MTDVPPPNCPLAEVGRYARLSAARERGLVVAAMGLPHWVVREGADYVLMVEPQACEPVRREVAKFEVETAELEPAPLERGHEKIPTRSLFVAAWLLGAFWLGQQVLPESLLDRGKAVSRLVLQGEWWRAVTSLTLHGDLSHFGANLATGLFFAAFVLPQLGPGLTWLAIVLSGVLGNLLNAFFYRGEPHVSIGASTAVFGALGLLVAGELVARLSSRRTRRGWQLIVPIGAGLALLAFLGTGDETSRVDYMAHLWGFLAGVFFGVLAAVARVRERVSGFGQGLAALLTAGLLIGAWWLAYAGAR
ncbi:MAG: rhomboid family intramembrane serine protease [Verrucomicrobiota bacterium]|nr:rhomboid family intramembrane serine protease [Verrucomicrobiota bacterium]